MALIAGIMHLVVGSAGGHAGHTARRPGMTIGAIWVQPCSEGVIGAMVRCCFVIIVADHTSGVGNAISAIDNGHPYRTRKGQPFRVGLSRIIVVMTQGTTVTSEAVVQHVDVVLRQQSAGASVAEVT